MALPAAMRRIEGLRNANARYQQTIEAQQSTIKSQQTQLEIQMDLSRHHEQVAKEGDGRLKRLLAAHKEALLARDRVAFDLNVFMSAQEERIAVLREEVSARVETIRVLNRELERMRESLSSS